MFYYTVIIQIFIKVTLLSLFQGMIYLKYELSLLSHKTKIVKVWLIQSKASSDSNIPPTIILLLKEFNISLFKL
jgi:hypothetical protein